MCDVRITLIFDDGVSGGKNCSSMESSAKRDRCDAVLFTAFNFLLEFLL